MSKNGRTTISRYEYLKIARNGFDWATKMDYILFFTGEEKRHKRTEVMLPRLVNRGDLVVQRHGKKLIYISRRKSKRPHLNIEHGLGCTSGLVRIWRSRMEGIIYPERKFRGFGIVPEWGIGYDNGKMLLFEFCTAKNFYKSGNVQGKITRYNNFLPLIEGKFGRDGIVVFVIDASWRDVDEFVNSRMPLGSQFFFTDYQTFRAEPIGEQLTASIYIWGEDGSLHSLSKDNV